LRRVGRLPVFQIGQGDLQHQQERQQEEEQQPDIGDDDDQPGSLMAEMHVHPAALTAIHDARSTAIGQQT
jgi:hypothetical protein